MSNRKQARALRRLSDQRCVYKEKEFVRLVRVAKVNIDEWGARFTFQVIPAPGFERCHRSTLTAAASWEAIGVSKSLVAATWVSWVLIVRPDLVQRIESYAAQGKSALELIDYINDLILYIPPDSIVGRLLFRLFVERSR